MVITYATGLLLLPPLPRADIDVLCLTCPGPSNGAFSVHGFNEQIFGADKQLKSQGWPR